MTRKILFATDGSENALNALKRWLAENALDSSSELHLLNVQLPVNGNVRSFVNPDTLSDYHREEGLTALSPTRQWLASRNLNAYQHVLVGHPADQICRFAQERGMETIVIGSHGRTGLMERLMGSVATEVKTKSVVPVNVML